MGNSLYICLSWIAKYWILDQDTILSWLRNQFQKAARSSIVFPGHSINPITSNQLSCKALISHDSRQDNQYPDNNGIPLIQWQCLWVNLLEKTPEATGMQPQVKTLTFYSLLLPLVRNLRRCAPANSCLNISHIFFNKKYFCVNNLNSEEVKHTEDKWKNVS